MDEEWRPIPGYENRYEASNLGRIRSVRVLRPFLAPTGYHRVSLGMTGSRRDQKTYSVHRLVYSTFKGDVRNSEEWCVNHLNGLKTDNRVVNLELVTRAGNSQHAARFNLMAHGERNGSSKLTAAQAREIKVSPLPWSILRKRYNCGMQTIARIKNGNTWVRETAGLDSPTPPNAPRSLYYNGESHTIREWAALIGITPAALKARVARGWPLERAMDPKRCPNQPLKLTESDVAFIRGSGLSNGRLAETFDVNQSTISRIKARLRRKHPWDG